MEEYTSWPSGLRDTTEYPKIEIKFDVSFREHLAAFLKMDGLGWNDYDQIKINQQDVKPQRMRAYRKMYEKLGLIYKDDYKICLSRLGIQMKNLEKDLNREKENMLDFLRRTAIDILSRYQIRNPVDDEPNLPKDCDVLACICIWKTMRELDNKIHYEEMNRVMLHIMKMNDLDAAIERIRIARIKYGKNYGKTDQLELDKFLGMQVHIDQQSARIAPWFSLVGWGGLIIEQKTDDEGYRNLVPECIPLIDKVLEKPPEYFNTDDEDEWFKYYIGTASDENISEREYDEEDALQDFENAERVKCGCNILVYGVPGCGKSYLIDTVYIKDVHEVVRVVFHPDYTYADFVGQIMPVSNDGKIEYTFLPGPFTDIMREAYIRPDKKYALIIEELNRGNAPTIFGDIFQLLDRDDDGSSKYSISNTDIADKMYLKTTKQGTGVVKIPSNLCIYSTMNTSDQNVFTLDTAFQRRWRMRIVENDVDKSAIARLLILDTSVTWATFNKAVNERILSMNVGMTSSEDKRLGAYFVTREDLKYHNPHDVGLSELERLAAEDANRNFPEKVLKYLWDDAFKFTRDQIFKEKYDSLEKLIKDFEIAKGNKRFEIFADNMFDVQQN